LLYFVKRMVEWTDERSTSRFYEISDMPATCKASALMYKVTADHPYEFVRPSLYFVSQFFDSRNGFIFAKAYGA